MAMLFANAPRSLTIGVRRDAIGAALVAAVAAISAFAYVHRATPQPTEPVKQVWTGNLTATASASMALPEPMSSSSLVVPKSAFSLPEPARPMPRIKNACDSADRLCVVRPAVTLMVPPKRQAMPAEPQLAMLPPETIPAPSQTKHAAKTAPAEQGFSLNPLRHLPDLSAIGQPFSAAGQAVGHWIKWL